MEHIYSGALKYKELKYPEQSDLMQELGNGQSPKSLLLTCSDSRISVNELTHTQPGQVFVIRNAGNVIAPYDPENPSNEALTLEYGVCALGVEEVVVCGHKSCGAMQGIQNLSSLDTLPLVKKGLERVSKQFVDADIQALSLDQLIIENVRQQLKHLYSYPFVQERVKAGKLQVWGWVYDFVNGNIPTKVSLNELIERGEV